MASIQLFPRAQSRRAPVDAWRAVPLVGGGPVRVREARPGDYGAVRALQQRGATATPPAAQRQFESRIHGFGAGQLVALCDGQLAGFASALLVDWEAHGGDPRTWASLTGEGGFTTHEPRARSLYGAELTVEASQRGSVAARALIQAHRRLVRRLDARRLVMTPPLAGYEGRASRMTPEEFAMRIVWGDASAPEWRFLMAQGFQLCGVLRDFHGEARHAGLLAWVNPLHAPPRPPANEESETTRECA